MSAPAYLKFEQIGMSFSRGQTTSEVLRDVDLDASPRASSCR